MDFRDSESFAVVSEASPHAIGPEFTKLKSAKVADTDIQITKALRENHPELCVTSVPDSNAPLLEFAAAGYATAELDLETESIFRWRGFVPPEHRGGTGGLGDAIFFAKYHYNWASQDYIVYLVNYGFTTIQYILKEPDRSKHEHQLSNCAASDELIRQCALAVIGTETDFIYVYDGYWTRSRQLWEEVQKSTWDKVILDPKMKKDLTTLTKNFFDSKDVYEKYGVPWKRGIIFYGPPGNGKTISVKSLMRELSRRENPIPTLYVKSAPYTYDIGDVFDFARSFSPCMLIMEDIETIVTSETRSYFFNEVDGLENNDGIFMVATTNYLERLDPGISKRPSRFDRKFDFPLPSQKERVQYAQFWRSKLADSSPEIEFPEKLCQSLADITKKFSFAYMQEAFIASLLMLAREDQDDGDDGDDDDNKTTNDSEDENLFSFEIKKDKKDDPLDKYRLWRALKASVSILREELDFQDEDILSLRRSSASKVPYRSVQNDSRAPPKDTSALRTFRDPVRDNYSPQNQTDLRRPGPLPGNGLRNMQPDQFSNLRHSSRVDMRAESFGRRIPPLKTAPTASDRVGIPSTSSSSSSSRIRTRPDSQHKQTTEPSYQELYNLDVGKDQYLTETAFDWRPL